MTPEIRRIIAADAHRRRTGSCPVLLHSLGTGESFPISPAADGFTDLQSGLRARVSGGQISLGGSRIDIALDDDIAFSGLDHASGERFSGRAGGGAIVTVYDGRMIDYFQYAVQTEG